MAMDARVPGVHDPGRHVTGSIRCPMMLATPIEPAIMTPVVDPEAPARRAAITASAGIYQGGAIPAPHPAAMPAVTESGTVIPSGLPGTSSRTATTLAKAADPAYARAAATSNCWDLPGVESQFC